MRMGVCGLPTIWPAGGCVPGSAPRPQGSISYPVAGSRSACFALFMSLLKIFPAAKIKRKTGKTKETTPRRA